MGAHQPLKHGVSVTDMKAEYDLSQLKSRKNPYASKLKKPVTMQLPGQQAQGENQVGAGCLTISLKQKMPSALDAYELSAIKLI